MEFLDIFLYWFYIFNLHNFIFQRLIWKMISVYFIWFDYWTLKEWKLQKYIIILLQHTNYLHKWLVHFLICLLLLSLFFSGKFLNVCKPRTITFILEQQNLSPLTGWPTWVGILWKWASMLPKLAGDGVCRLALFHALKIFLANEIYHFSRLSHQTIYLGNLLHIISSLFSHFRSWDYPEHFGIYSQLNRKSKKPGFSFSPRCVSWIEQD